MIIKETEKILLQNKDVISNKRQPTTTNLTKPKK